MRLTNPASEVGVGRKTVATGGTAERLVSTSTPINAVTITAETDNTGYIVVGDSTVDADSLSEFFNQNG